MEGLAPWACDFLQVYDVWFRPLVAFFVIDVNTKEVVHLAVTREPNEHWTAQQLRELSTRMGISSPKGSP